MMFFLLMKQVKYFYFLFKYIAIVNTINNVYTCFNNKSVYKKIINFKPDFYEFEKAYLRPYSFFSNQF